jgi:hypothetical protein
MLAMGTPINTMIVFRGGDHMRYNIRLLIISVGLVVFGAVFLLKSLPSDGPVMCGDQEMHPGDWCQRGGGQPVFPGGARPSNYDSYAEDQHRLDPQGMTFGGIALVGGVGLLALTLWSGRRTAAA